MGLFSKLFSKNKEEVKNLNTEVSGTDIIIAGEIVKENEPVKEDPSVYYVLFTNKISGLKEVAFDTRMLLVNDHPVNNLVIYYEFENNVKKEVISRSNIQEITLNTRIQVDGVKHADVDYSSIDKNLISQAEFGGQPLSQFLSNREEKTEEIVDKMTLNSYYELTIVFINEENENQKIMFRIDKNSDKFISFLKNNIGKK